MTKELSRLIMTAAKNGWFVKRTNKHYILFAPQGKGIVVLASTPSDWRGYHNALSELRKLGLKV